MDASREPGRDARTAFDAAPFRPCPCFGEPGCECDDTPCGNTTCIVRDPCNGWYGGCPHVECDNDDQPVDAGPDAAETRYAIPVFCCRGHARSGADLHNCGFCRNDCEIRGDHSCGRFTDGVNTDPSAPYGCGD